MKNKINELQTVLQSQLEKNPALFEKVISLLTFHFSRKRRAFTLAEVLITLGIIGVVAALTLPTLIEQHKEQVTVNKVKKMYSVLSQALLFAISDNGTLNEWDISGSQSKENAEKFMSYLKPYLLISKDCGTKPGCLKKYNEGLFLLSGGPVINNYDNVNSYYKFILHDGTYIWLRTSMGEYCKSPDTNLQDACGAIFIDVNGEKLPNTIGKDIFGFAFLKDRIMPTDADLCATNLPGWGCGGYILKYGNMDYLHKKTGK